MAAGRDDNEIYRQTQSQIYNLQQTILNSSRMQDAAKPPAQEKTLFSSDDTTKKQAIKHPAVEVNSRPVLELVAAHYAGNRRHLGPLRYNAWAGIRDKDASNINDTPAPDMPDLDYMRFLMPRPLLPAYQTAEINCTVTIEVSYEDIVAATQPHPSNPHVVNNEIWGSQIYTDDSDILLVLQHCGAIPSSCALAGARTPANLEDPDHVTGVIPPSPTPYDLKVDILLLPPLQSYSDSLNNDVKSRSWRGCHDGLSFGIYGIEIKTRDTSLRDVSSQDQVKAIEW